MSSNQQRLVLRGFITWLCREDCSVTHDSIAKPFTFSFGPRPHRRSIALHLHRLQQEGRHHRHHQHPRCRRGPHQPHFRNLGSLAHHQHPSRRRPRILRSRRRPFHPLLPCRRPLVLPPPRIATPSPRRPFRLVFCKFFFAKEDGLGDGAGEKQGTDPRISSWDDLLDGCGSQVVKERIVHFRK